MSIFRSSERHRYTPPDCPVCDARPRVNWVEVPMSGDDLMDPPAIPGTLVCPNDGDAAHVEYWAALRNRRLTDG